MMKTTLITTGIVASLILGVASYARPLQVSVSPTPVQVNVPKQETPVVNIAAPDIKIPQTVVNVPAQQVAQNTDSSFGAVGGPDNYLPYWGINDVRSFFSKKVLVTATTTPCAFLSPPATSTLTSSVVNVRIGTSTATIWTIATSTTAFATTSQGAQFNLGSGAQGSFSYKAPLLQDALIAPRTYVVWGVQGSLVGGAGGAGALAGTCSAEFRQI